MTVVVHLTDCWVHVQYLIERGGDTICSASKSVWVGDFLSIGSNGWKFPTLCYNVPEILLGVVD